MGFGRLKGIFLEEISNELYLPTFCIFIETTKIKWTMKKAKLTYVSLFLFSLLSTGSFGQKNWRIELNSMGGMVLGDFSKSDPLNNTSGFSEYSYFADLTAKYFFDDLGVGVKLYSGGFSLDNEKYSEGLASVLGATSDAIFYRQNIGYFSFGTQVGLSYKINFSEQFNLEPSIYGGFFNMVSLQTT